MTYMIQLIALAAICWFGKMIYEIVTQGIAEAKVKAWTCQQIRENERMRK